METIHPLKLEALLEASQPLKSWTSVRVLNSKRSTSKARIQLPRRRFQPENLFAPANCAAWQANDPAKTTVTCCT